MSTQNQKTERVLQLADRIVSDIRDKGLKTGDRYLSTIKTARMLRVDTTDINKAMQLLVKKHVLLRRQRLGTFIGKGLDATHVARLRSVRFLVFYGETPGDELFDSQIMMGLQEALPHVKLGVHFVSRENEAEELNRLIGEILRNPEPEGLILIGSTLHMQRTVAASGLPTVVSGHLYPSVKGMSYVDCDPVQIGRELTNHLLECGHRRIMCVFRQQMMPSDHIMFDTVAKTLSEKGLPSSNLLMRCLPLDEAVIASEVEDFLELSRESIGFLVRGASKADLVHDIITARLGEGNSAATVVSADDHFGSTEGEGPYPRMVAKLSLKEQGAVLGRMLLRLTEDDEAYIQSDLLEVQLVSPTKTFVSR